MPLTTIYDGGTRVIGSGTVISQGLHPIVMEYISIMSSNGGYSMTLNEIDAINNMVLALEANGIWTKMQAIYPVLGGTAATHKFNLKDPRDVDAAFRLVFSAGWTHSSNGMTPNGAATANTFLAPSTIGVSHHISYYSRTQVSQSSNEIGASVGGGQVSIAFYFSAINIKAFVSGGYPGFVASIAGSTNTLGHLVGSRIANNDLRLFFNGVQLASSTASTTTFSTSTFKIGANDTTEGSTKQCAFASIGNGLTGVEVTAFYSIVQAYQQKLGRAV